MADIISGSSRFNGDKNAPARKVIQMNNVSEAATLLTGKILSLLAI